MNAQPSAAGSADPLRMEPPANPFRSTDHGRSSPDPCTVVIFGATGDLTHRKLIPALYNLAQDGDLPSGCAVVGVARREKSDAEFRAGLEAAARQFSRQGLKDEQWRDFAKHLFYHRCDFSDPEGFRSLASRLREIESAAATRGNRLHYLASAPESFPDILEHLRTSGLNRPDGGEWARTVIEKPFGRDLPTATRLNAIAARCFAERDTFRIDHYLGKETAQNIMALRFANAIFEPLWNNRHIDHVQITASEALGVEGRGGYYDTAGALRDMVQNHLLQLLCLVAMEPPTDLRADSVRDEKVKVLRSLRRIPPEEVAAQTVRGQYAGGNVHGQPVPAYRKEPRVPPGSETETYVALRLFIDNWRWAGVPFFVRVGKRLPKPATEIAVTFKAAPPVLLSRLADAPEPNTLAIRIQPDEGISLRMQAKMPGTLLRLEPVKMDFRYRTSFGKASPEAYERLLLDAMAGDATLFARRDEVEEAWRFIDPIEQAWLDHRAPLHTYPAGSWGPDAAHALLAATGHIWRTI